MAMIDTLEVGVEVKECKKCEYKLRCDECANNQTETKPKTNADRIRRMNNKELGAFLFDIREGCGTGICTNCPMYAAGDCSKWDILDWLEKEAETNGA